MRILPSSSGQARRGTGFQKGLWHHMLGHCACTPSIPGGFVLVCGFLFGEMGCAAGKNWISKIVYILNVQICI